MERGYMTYCGQDQSPGNSRSGLQGIACPFPMVVPSRGAVWIRAVGIAALTLFSLLGLPRDVQANNLGENGVWQFAASQDKVNKAATLDQIEKKKAGYYNAITPVYNYTTYIARQVNCTVSALTTANTGSTSATAANSSPTVSNAGTTSSSTAANSASNSLPPGAASGALNAGASSLGNSQNNSGGLASGVSGSSTSASTGAINAGAGTSSQTLNSQQSNSGTLNTSVAGSTACSGPFN